MGVLQPGEHSPFSIYTPLGRILPSLPSQRGGIPTLPAKRAPGWAQPELSIFSPAAREGRGGR